MTTPSEEFEIAITQLTEPLNGQLPRPWMSDLTDPMSATLFVVGKNQRNGYPIERLTHERHLNALFNRAGETCRGVYDEMTHGVPSPTRDNTDAFSRILRIAGVTRVLETNVVCYSTPMSADLRLSRHIGGVSRGTELFQALIHFIKPRVLVAHGAGTRAGLTKVLGQALPEIPTEGSPPSVARVRGMSVFVIPSLAPPEWNKWHAWAEPHLSSVAKAAASAL